MTQATLTKRGFFAAIGASMLAPLLPRSALARQPSQLFTQTSHKALMALSELVIQSPDSCTFVVMRDFQGVKKEYVAGLERSCGRTLYSIKFAFDPPIDKDEVFYINSYGYNDL